MFSIWIRGSLDQWKIIYYYVQNNNCIASLVPTPTLRQHSESQMGKCIRGAKYSLCKGQKKMDFFFLPMYRRKIQLSFSPFQRKIPCFLETEWKGFWVLTLIFWNVNTSLQNPDMSPDCQALVTYRNLSQFPGLIFPWNINSYIWCKLTSQDLFLSQRMKFLQNFFRKL